MINFYDTCSLLKRVNNLFDNPEEEIIISSITLNELESIKTSSKDYDVKMAARRILNLLDANPLYYTIWSYRPSSISCIVERDLEVSNDTKILASALDCSKMIKPDRLTFITNDLALKAIAGLFYKDIDVSSVNETNEEYSGYQEKVLTEEELIDFYSNPTNNIFNLNINEYLIIKNDKDEVVDTYCWTGSEHRHLSYQNFKSRWFGDVKPLKGDIYQALLADSLATNRITLVKGPAGSGKTFMSLGYLLAQLDRGKIDRIVVFCNTVATKDSAKLGLITG